MAEHVGRVGMPGYVAALHGLLRPGGRLLHHAITWAAGDVTWRDDTFIARYVFPGSTRAAVHGMTMTIGDRRVVARIQEREEARAERDFERADRLRDELAGRGWEVRDGPDGARLVRRP